jgi:glycosyltransferase involved in cell wall biosynthesis
MTKILDKNPIISPNVRKCCIVTPTLRVVGGVEVINTQLEKLLKNIGFKVDYRTLDDSYLNRSFFKKIGNPILFNLFSFMKLRNYDLIIANGEYCFFILGSNVVQVNHGSYAGIIEKLDRFHGLKTKITTRRDRFFQNVASRNVYSVAVSESCKQEIERNHGKVDQVINNPVTMQVPSEINQADARDIDFLFIAQFGDFYRKGIDFVTFCAGQGLKITCAGRGYDAAITKLHCVGHINHTEMSALYQRAKFLIMPSRYEGYQLTPLEAMIHGCIPLISPVGLGADLQNQGYEGILDFHKDWDDAVKILKQKLVVYAEEFILTDDLRQRMSVQAWEHKWEDLIKKIVK